MQGELKSSLESQSVFSFSTHQDLQRNSILDGYTLRSNVAFNMEIHDEAPPDEPPQHRAAEQVHRFERERRTSMLRSVFYAGIASIAVTAGGLRERIGAVLAVRDSALPAQASLAGASHLHEPVVPPFKPQGNDKTMLQQRVRRFSVEHQQEILGAFEVRFFVAFDLDVYPPEEQDGILGLIEALLKKDTDGMKREIENCPVLMQDLAHIEDVSGRKPENYQLMENARMIVSAVHEKDIPLTIEILTRRLEYLDAKKRSLLELEQFLGLPKNMLVHAQKIGLERVQAKTAHDALQRGKPVKVLMRTMTPERVLQMTHEKMIESYIQGMASQANAIKKQGMPHAQPGFVALAVALKHERDAWHAEQAIAMQELARGEVPASEEAASPARGVSH